MCADPVTLTAIAAAATAAGAGVKNVEQNRYIKKVNNANRQAVDYSRAMKDAERGRQKGFEGEQIAAHQGALDAATRQSVEANQGGAAQAFMDAYDAQAPLLPNGRLSGQENADQEVQTEIARRTAEATAKARARAAALAKLTGYGVAGGALSRSIGEANNQLSTIGGLRRGSLAVNNQETNVPAATVTPKSSGLGEALQLAGQVLSMGAGGGFGGGTPSFAAMLRSQPASFTV